MDVKSGDGCQIFDGDGQAIGEGEPVQLRHLPRRKEVHPPTKVAAISSTMDLRDSFEIGGCQIL